MGGCHSDGGSPPLIEEDGQAVARRAMVARQIERRGVTDARVLEAMRTVPRHLFVPSRLADEAYRDSPLPIGEGQTISQPYIVALMSELLDLEPGARVLEIGTGSGYQAAVLAAMGLEVYSIEIVDELCRQARATLEATGYGAVTVRCGDGTSGWPEHAPFDGVIVTAAPEEVPEALTRQLKVGGRLVIPVGAVYQELIVVTRTADGFRERSVIPVRFVPMTGDASR
jgi:protein-L-isoaspartate(D-aspartate) O-methyltransferase